MPTSKPKLTEFEVGVYVCPKTKCPASLRASCSFAYIEWPVVVEHCTSCGERHVLNCQEVLHSPVFGRE
jgi:hypothetical protein